MGVKGSQRIRLTSSPPSVSLPPRKFGGLDVSQPYGSPWPVTGLASLFFNTTYLAKWLGGVLTCIQKVSSFKFA
jgi:hypothetical protein